MKSEIKEISPTQKEIHLEIDAEAVKAAYGKVSRSMPSEQTFRAFGRAMLRSTWFGCVLRKRSRARCCRKWFRLRSLQRYRSTTLHPLAEPHLHLDDQENVKVNGSEPLSLHVHVEVMPEIPTPNYKDIEVTRRVKPVVDGEVEDLIAERLQKEAALIPVEGRKSKIGDTVIADLEGRFDDAPDAEPIKADDLEVELGGEHIEKSFTDNLIGVKEDDEKEFTVVYPAEFSSEALAGKTVHYKAKIKSVGKTEIPELNDEWAKSLDEGYKSLADLRKVESRPRKIRRDRRRRRVCETTRSQS